MKASYKRAAFSWGSAVAVAVIVFYLAKPWLNAGYRSGLVSGNVVLWLWFVARPFARRAWPDVKQGWAE